MERWLVGRGAVARSWTAALEGEVPAYTTGERIWRSLKPASESSRFRNSVKAGVGVFSKKVLRRWMVYAVAGLAIGFVSWQVFQSNFSSPVSVPEVYTAYTTKPGQRASLTLSDGSFVTLGPLTTLRVRKSAVSSNAIAVEVTGEALFNVSHAAKIPFIVTAHGVTARVLGTEFIVRAYDASLVRVAVRDGRVSVQSPVITSANVVIINAGEAVSATPNALPAVTPITDIATDFAWANGELVLKNVPLGEAFVRLSRWYGMDFRVTDPDFLKTKKIDAVFPSTFNRADIEALGIAIKADVKYSGSVVTFTTSS